MAKNKKRNQGKKPFLRWLGDPAAWTVTINTGGQFCEVLKVGDLESTIASVSADGNKPNFSKYRLKFTARCTSPFYIQPVIVRMASGTTLTTNTESADSKVHEILAAAINADFEYEILGEPIIAKCYTATPDYLIQKSLDLTKYAKKVSAEAENIDSSVQTDVVLICMKPISAANIIIDGADFGDYVEVPAKLHF